MLQNLSVRDLYLPALTEGEGVGTAYEYYVKRRALQGWIKDRSKPTSLLIAGLPQKYGSSLDFFLLAQELDLGQSLTVIDERPAAIEKAQRALAIMHEHGWMQNVKPTWLTVENISEFVLDSHFDLAICSEVLQRIPAAERDAYARSLCSAATATAVFCPNKDNDAHVGISELDGLLLSEIQALFSGSDVSGYIDMPPFPPGITRTEDQREQASTGTFEAVAMWGLTWFARSEWLIPPGIRRKQSHIVYAFGSAG